jgi:hypothetical protein
MMVKRVISPRTVMALGFALIAIAGLDVYALQSLAARSKPTPSLADAKVFLSQVTLALYLLLAMFGGIGVNVVPPILVRHLVDAEERSAKEPPLD